MSKTDKTSTTDAADAAQPAQPVSLAAQTGLTLEGATAAINELNAKFAQQAEENGQLRRSLVAQEAMIAKMTAGKTAGKFGSVAIEMRHCNVCGTEVAEGERCPKPGHKRAKVNEIGIGMHHNIMQPIIIRQV